MIIALAILAFFALTAVYMITDLTELANEQLLDAATEQEWDAWCAENSRFDWQAFILASLPAPHRAGERGDRPDSLRSSALRGAPAGATVFDWDADGFGDAA